MPVHRVPVASLDADLRSIEREGEDIVSVTRDGDRYLVVTKFRGLETRSA